MNFKRQGYNSLEKRPHKIAFNLERNQFSKETFSSVLIYQKSNLEINRTLYYPKLLSITVTGQN